MDDRHTRIRRGTGRVHAPGRTAALVAGALLFFVAFWKLRLYDPGVQLTGESFDTYGQLLPMWQRSAEWMRSGHLPLWNPYQGCGQPFLASLLYGVFYPLHASLLLFDAAAVLEISTVVHLFLAWLFTWMFARSCGLGRLASTVAGLAFSLSGILVHQVVWFVPAAAAGIWLPLALLAVEKLIRSQRWRWAVVLGVAVAMPVYAGFLQNFLYVAYAVALYAAARLFTAARGSAGWRSAAAAGTRIGAGVLLGSALSAAQLLPSLELFDLGSRGAGPLSQAGMFLFPPPPPRMLLAQAFDARPGNARYSYVGVVVLMLLPALPWTRRRAQAAALVLVTIFGLLAMLTLHTPFWALYSALPGVTSFRIPWRVALVYAFGASMLGAFALDAFVRRPPPVRRRIAAACAVVAAAALLGIEMPAPSRAYILAAIGFLALGAWLPGPRRRRWALTALVALVAVELFRSTWSVASHPLRDASIYEKEAALLSLLRDRAALDRVYIHAVAPAGLEVTPKVATLRGFPSIADYEAMSLLRHAYYFAGTDPSVRRLGFYPIPFDGVLNVAAEPANLAILSQLSVRFVAVPQGNAAYRRVLQQGGWQRVSAPAGSAFALYENPRPLPRAFVASNVVALDGDRAIRAVWSPDFDPFRVTVVELPEGESPGAPRSGLPIEPATITRYEPTRVEITTDSTRAGFLVLTDTAYPGWRATVDGVPARIVTANYLFRAVPVGRGRHTVVFTYAPSSLRWGLAISAAALLAAAAILWRELGRRSRRRREETICHRATATGRIRG